MKIFITGATGFIGSKLALQLANQGHKVHAIYRSQVKTEVIKHPNILTYKGDLYDAQSIETAMDGCKFVFHVAAYAKTWAKQRDTFYQYNVVGTQNVLDCAVKLGVQKVVVTSTAGVFSPSNQSPVAEDTPRTIPFFNDYESSKAQAEEMIKGYVKKGLYVVIVNPPRVYGPGILSDSNAVTKMIMLYAKGKFRILPGDGKSIGNYVFVDDVVNGHILAMEKGRNGERYILGGENHSYSDFFQVESQIIGKKYFQFKLPISVMLFISGAMTLAARWFGITPLITPNWVRKYLYNWELTSQKAIDELGYTITPLSEGISKTIEWMNLNNNESIHA